MLFIYLFIYARVYLAAENIMFSNGADMNKHPIPLLHASSHDSRKTSGLIEVMVYMVEYYVNVRRGRRIPGKKK